MLDLPEPQKKKKKHKPAKMWTDLKAIAENGHTENGAAAKKRKAESNDKNRENGINGAQREKTTAWKSESVNHNFSWIIIAVRLKAIADKPPIS